MSAPERRVPVRFLVGFGLVAVLIAGLLSYLAYPHPDGLDTVTMDGCEVTEADGAERLEGECIARNAEDHRLAGGPLADYTVNGDDGLLGFAGVLGVLATLVVAGGLFWLLRPRRAAPADERSPDGTG